MLKSKPEFRRAPQVATYYDVDDIFGTASRRQYFKDLKEKLEAQESKVANVSFQNSLINSRRKSNYEAELRRIREVLKNRTVTTDAETIGRLRAKEAELEEMIKDIS